MSPSKKQEHRWKIFIGIGRSRIHVGRIAAADVMSAVEQALRKFEISESVGRTVEAEPA